MVVLRSNGSSPGLAPALLGLGLLVLGLQGCRPNPAPVPRAGSPSPAEEVRQAQARRQAELRLARDCRLRRQELFEGLAELRRAEAALADQNAALPPASPPRPLWDAARESRFSQQDQELDRQRYEAELEAWRELQARNAVAWQQRSQQRDQAQERLNRQSRLLHQRFAGLFTGPTSIELNPQELERLSRCPRADG